MRNSHFPYVNSYRVLNRMLTLYRQLKKQERYIKNYLPNLLAEVAPDNDHAFSPRHVNRIVKYWQLSLNIICDNLYWLTKKKINTDEYKRIILLSIFGPLFDDLFDDRILDDSQIALLVAKPEEYVPVNATDHLVKKIYLELLRLTPHRTQFIEHLQQLSHWQQASLKQLSPDISEDELHQVTYNKSYYAVLLYCAVLDHYPNQETEKMLYHIAGLMQLTNDAFDVWKDVHNGVYTLPNLYLNFEKLQQQFMAEIAQINHILWQLPYTAGAKQNYAITVHSLHAMGWMALEQLKEVTTGISTFAELSTMDRKTLVCDMDSIKQKMKWLKHIRRLTNYSF